jgi:LCP family protein required for cell wall assembly
MKGVPVSDQSRPPLDAGQESRESLRRDLAHRFHRAIGLTALGTILPGAGLTRTRSRRLGWMLLVIALALGASVAWQLLTRGLIDSGLALLGRPGLLRAIAIAALVGGLVWCASIVLTAIRARPARLERGRTHVLAAFTTVMVLFVAAGAYKVAEYATLTQDTVAAVFSPDQPGTPVGPPLAEGKDPWANTPRVNILLLGSDAGVDRTGTRTDSMVVASIDTKTGNTVLISLPRNLQYVPIPASSPLRKLYPSGVYGKPVCIRQQQDAADGCLLNAIWTEADEWAAAHPHSFPGVKSPGRSTTRDVIADLLGLHIDHTVVADLHGFVQLVDAMGGVGINVQKSANGTDLPIGGHVTASGQVVGVTGYFKPGLQHLDGWHTLWYARSRAADSDYARMARQRCVIKAVVNQVNPTAMLGKYADLARIAKENIYTDIPSSHLAAYVTLIERVQNAQITSVALDPAHGINPGDPNFSKIRADVNKALHRAASKPSAPTTATPTSTPTTTSTSTGYGC